MFGRANFLVFMLSFAAASSFGQGEPPQPDELCRYQDDGKLYGCGISLLQNSASSRRSLEDRLLTQEALVNKEKQLREREASLQLWEEELRKKEAEHIHYLTNERTNHHLHNNTARAIHQVHGQPQNSTMTVLGQQIFIELPTGNMNFAYVATHLATPFMFVTVNLLLVLLCACLAENQRLLNVASEVPSASKEHSHMRNTNWSDNRKLMTLIQEALETERHIDVTCCSMMLNRPWQKAGPKVIVENPSPNKEWRDGDYWPGGGRPPEEDAPGRMHHFVYFFWRFLFFYKKPYFSLTMMFLCGVLPPLETVIFSWIADGIGPGGSDAMLLKNLVLLAVVHFARDRAYYCYEIDVPAASVRWELRHRLERQFLSMQGDKAKCWTPGRAVAVMDHDVHIAVNSCWKAVFHLTKHFSAVIALVISFYCMNKNRIPSIGLPAVVVFLSLIGGSMSIVYGRQHNLFDLTKRKQNWRMAWMGIATKQLDDHRDGRLQQSLDDAQLELGKAAFLYRKRAFHCYFGLLTASMAMTEMALLSKCLLAFFGGVLAIHGQLTTGQALALLSLGDLMSKALSGMVEELLQIRQGYISVVELAEVFNSDVV